MSGIYIHIPFCKTRCIYCGFYSTTLHKLQDKYVYAVLKEFEQRKNYLTQPVETIYLGGGTPSQLSLQNLRRLFEGILPNRGEGIPYYNIKEVTVECNPDDVTTELVRELKSLGVNRISMGVQSFSDERLHFLRRRHSADQARKAVKIIRSEGIQNISIDLMFGFPDETLEDWDYDISEALKLDVQHISAYSLMYEEGTSLYKMLEEGKIHEIDEELSRKMYYHLIDRLEAAGYEHYEISNFARPGFRSKHNSSYWHEVPYLGLGAGAHSYNLTTRQNNGPLLLPPPQMEESEYLYKVEEVETLDEVTRYNDLITTSLRTYEGVEIKEGFYYDYMMKTVKPLIAEGLLAIDNNHLHLTREGLYVSDDIMSELIFLAE